MYTFMLAQIIDIIDYVTYAQACPHILTWEGNVHARLMCRLILYIHGYNGVTCVDRNVPVGQWLVGASTWSEFDGRVQHA